MALIDLQNISKQYDTKVILSAIPCNFIVVIICIIK
jgi:hypothetical protein